MTPKPAPTPATTDDRALAAPSPGGSMAGFAINVADVTQAMAVCEMLAKSTLIPTAFRGKPGDIFVAGMMAHTLGVPLFTALSGIAVINGKPTAFGDLIVAVCQSDPRWGGMNEAYVTDPEEGLTAVCTVTVRGENDPYVGRFSMKEAKVANLVGKQGPWSQFPKRMLMWRARSYALRAAYAARLQGIQIREEWEGVDAPAEVQRPSRFTRDEANAPTDTALPVLPEPKPAKEPTTAEYRMPDDDGSVEETPSVDVHEDIPAEPDISAEKLAARAKGYAEETDGGMAIMKGLIVKLGAKTFGALTDQAKIRYAWNVIDDFEGLPVTFATNVWRPE